MFDFSDDIYLEHAETMKRFRRSHGDRCIRAELLRTLPELRLDITFVETGGIRKLNRDCLFPLKSVAPFRILPN